MSGLSVGGVAAGTAGGLPVGGFLVIVVVITTLNVGGAIGYHKFTEKNPEKAVSVKMDPGLGSKLRCV